MTATSYTVGADECGYGSIAGPLVVAATAFPDDCPRPAIEYRGRRLEVADSKTITRLAIPLLAQATREACMPWFETYTLSNKDIDILGVDVARRQALRMVIQRLLERMQFQLQITPEQYKVIVDGDGDLQPCKFTYDAIPDADATVLAVSAASIIAKELQLTQMSVLNTLHPEYEWIDNAGYPTKKHLDALKKHGVSPYHRCSYAPVRAQLDKRRGRWG